MRVLLDTHAFLWYLSDNPGCSATCRSLIEHPESELLLSAGSCWEIAIKQSLGKLKFDMPVDQFLTAAMHDNGISLLSIDPRHLGVVASLPFHHRDPFDRLLVAQSLVEKIPVLSRDAALDAYRVQRLW